MQFKLPQFIERESSILGSLSFRQFLYFGAAAGITFVSWGIVYPLSQELFFILAGFLFLAAAALAFAKVEGRNLGNVVVSMFYFFLYPRVYVWQRKNFTIKYSSPKKEVEKEETKKTPLSKRRMELDDLMDEIELNN